MSDETIRVGDLVMMVRQRICCTSSKGVGGIHTVTGFYNGYQCGACGVRVMVPVALIDGKWEGRALSTLKKNQSAADKGIHRN